MDFLQHVVSTCSTLALSPCLWNCRIDSVCGSLLAPLAASVKRNGETPVAPIRANFVAHEMLHAKAIGFADRNGNLIWKRWWELPSHLWPLARLLSRGSSWYFYNADRKPKRNAPSSLSFRGFARVRTNLSRCGINVVKEDRGKRFVLVSSGLISTWWRAETETRSFTPSPPSELKVARSYFTAKTTKDPPLKGRLIEAFGKIRPKHIIPDSFFEPFKHDCTSRAAALAAIFPDGNPVPEGYVIFTGDIDKMYPSTRQNLLLYHLRDRFGEKLARRVLFQLLHYRILHRKQTFSCSSGLPIGHPWSPELARVLLDIHEIDFFKTIRLVKHGDQVRLARYVDDGCFACDARIAPEVRAAYELAVYPWTVKWDLDDTPFVKFLDLQFRRNPTGVIRNDLLLIDKLQFPCGSIPKKLLTACALGKVYTLTSIRAEDFEFYPPRDMITELLAGDETIQDPERNYQDLDLGVTNPDFERLQAVCAGRSINLPKEVAWRRGRRSTWYLQGVTNDGKVTGLRGCRSLYTLFRVGFNKLRNRRF